MFPNCSFCEKYLSQLYSHYTQNCNFCTFWRLNTLVLWGKIFQNLIMFVHLFCPKNRKTCINSVMVGCRKLPDPSINHIFNAPSISISIPSHLNDLNLVWGTSFEETAKSIQLNLLYEFVTWVMRIISITLYLLINLQKTLLKTFATVSKKIKFDVAETYGFHVVFANVDHILENFQVKLHTCTGV